MTWTETLKRKAVRIHADTLALSLAMRRPDVPWYAKAVAGAVVAYALSPIDLIPDFIPVLGHLDDLVLLPLGIALAIRLIPPDILEECRAQASRRLAGDGRKYRWVAAIVILVWVALLALVVMRIVSRTA